MEQLKNSIVKHLKRRASDGRWIHQRIMRDSIHAESAELFNQAALALVNEGIVEVDGEGSHCKKVIRLKIQTPTHPECLQVQDGYKTGNVGYDAMPTHPECLLIQA